MIYAATALTFAICSAAALVLILTGSVSTALLCALFLGIGAAAVLGIEL